MATPFPSNLADSRYHLHHSMYALMKRGMLLKLNSLVSICPPERLLFLMFMFVKSEKRDGLNRQTLYKRCGLAIRHTLVYFIYKSIGYVGSLFNSGPSFPGQSISCPFSHRPSSDCVKPSFSDQELEQHWVRSSHIRSIGLG